MIGSTLAFSDISRAGCRAGRVLQAFGAWLLHQNVVSILPYNPSSDIQPQAGFVNRRVTEGMENTEDLGPAFFESDCWFPQNLCGRAPTLGKNEGRTADEQEQHR